ncbi:MAG: START domain-containing protein [Spirochaetes bacterium]|nr:START domain-containing protein [Spirochaetota bacterium]
MVLFLSQVFSFSASADNGWKLQRNKDGIRAYLRDIPDQKLKEFLGVMLVRGVRLSSMVATFDDTASYTRWMHNCTESRLLKYINVQERITYTVTHAPWPATDRDTVVYSLMSQNPADNSVTIAITGKPDYMPRQPKRLRIPMMKATWTFRPLESGDVMIMYQTVTDPGGPLPRALLNLSVVDLPFYTMHKFRDVVKEDRYAAATYTVIKEPALN